MTYRHSSTALPRGWYRAFAVLPTAALSYAAGHAQDAFVSPTQVNQPMPTVEQAASRQIGSIAAPELRRPSEGATPLTWGPLRFLPRLGYQVVYGDGVLRDPDGPAKTILHTVSPGIAVELGRFWDLDFGASINRYSNREFNNNTSYSLGLSGRIPLEQWILRFGYDFRTTEQPQIETGTQSAEVSHTVTAGGLYNYNQRFSVDAGVSASTRQTQQFSDYSEFSTAEWLNYHATTKTTLGLGLAGGYNIVEPGADSIYGRPQARIIWAPGSRLSFQLSAGVQFQQFLQESHGLTLPVAQPPGGRDQPSDDNELGVFPLFQASIVYQVSDPLSLSLNASHEVGNSVLAGLFTESTSVGVGVSQRLFKQLHLNVSPNYRSEQYRSTGRGLSVSREDEYFSLNVGLSTRLFKKLNTSIFYQYSDNSSTGDGFAFASTQVGFQLSYQY